MNRMTPRQQQFFNALPTSWQPALQQICQSSQIESLVQFLQEREAAGAVIFPQKQHIFAALKAAPFDHVAVVIVGQDPYHGPGQAHGLSFSVPAGVTIPPSLRNIFKEIQQDVGATCIQNSGTLKPWAEQGVLLLNAILSVEQASPASHAGKGWEFFTDAVIVELMKRTQPTVFMLWGAYAQKKLENLQAYFDPSKHLILKSAHPSPYSATNFFGCRHFSQANAFLKKHGLKEISW